MRVFIKQPKGTRICGQIALAHLLGCTLDEAILRMGHRHSTKVSDMVRALKAAAICCPDKLVRLKNPEISPTTCLIKLSHTKSTRWHWVARIHGMYWDGLNFEHETKFPNWPADWKPTSVLPVFW